MTCRAAPAFVNLEARMRGGGGISGCAATLCRAAITVRAPATPHGGTDPQALADQAIRRLDLQTELLHRPPPFSVSLTLPPALLWLVVAVGLAVLLYAFRDMIPVLRGRERDALSDIEEDRATATGGRTPEHAIGAADELAATGRFVEAMHVLLLQALAEIRRRLNQQFADSMTSREILRSRGLSDELRRPLHDVIDRVEWCYFGERPAAREDYLACRASFGTLAQALRRAADA